MVEQPSGAGRRTSLLKRLAQVGLGRREDEEGGQHAGSPPVAPMPAPQADHARRAAPPHAAEGQLDPHGRAVPDPRSFEDDQLEIPAFLRRHAN
jgi:cell division protein FtsZ